MRAGRASIQYHLIVISLFDIYCFELKITFIFSKINMFTNILSAVFDGMMHVGGSSLLCGPTYLESTAVSLASKKAGLSAIIES